MPFRDHTKVSIAVITKGIINEGLILFFCRRASSFGEANVAQEDLDKFLAVAEELQVKGLTQEGAD